ncbi:MAG: hypothetical protein AAB491_01305 [Patescibacteria group bacterium]
MTNNHLYNLMKQLVQENKSLWRIKKNYLKDSKNCKDCKNFWKKMEKDKERHVKEMEKMIRKHL